MRSTEVVWQGRIRSPQKTESVDLKPQFRKAVVFQLRQTGVLRKKRWWRAPRLHEHWPARPEFQFDWLLSMLDKLLALNVRRLQPLPSRETILPSKSQLDTLDLLLIRTAPSTGRNDEG